MPKRTAASTVHMKYFFLISANEVVHNFDGGCIKLVRLFTTSTLARLLETEFNPIILRSSSEDDPDGSIING